jgi:DNA replication protein DnaC
MGRAAYVQGYRERYASVAKLLQEFTAASADGTFSRVLADSAQLDLLLIDEFGFDRLEREAQAGTFYYRPLDAHTGRRSTALAANIEFGAWADSLGDTATGNGVPRPPGRRRRDPQARRALVPRPTPTRDRQGRPDVTTLSVR